LLTEELNIDMAETYVEVDGYRARQVTAESQAEDIFMISTEIETAPGEVFSIMIAGPYNEKDDNLQVYDDLIQSFKVLN
jgi:hypothetical protein